MDKLICSVLLISIFEDGTAIQASVYLFSTGKCLAPSVDLGSRALNQSRIGQIGCIKWHFQLQGHCLHHAAT